MVELVVSASGETAMERPPSPLVGVLGRAVGVTPGCWVGSAVGVGGGSVGFPELSLVQSQLLDGVVRMFYSDQVYVPVELLVPTTKACCIAGASGDTR